MKVLISSCSTEIETESGNSPFHDWLFSFALQCNPTWTRGNFRQKQQIHLKYVHAGYIGMQMNKVNRQKGYNRFIFV